MKPKPWTPAEDDVIRSASSVSEVMAQLPHRTRAAIKTRKKLLRIIWSEPLTPLPGERWEKVPGWILALSTYGRSARSDTMTAKRASAPNGITRGQQPTFSVQRDDGTWSTIAIDVAISLAFDKPLVRDLAFKRRWTAEEDAILREAETADEVSRRTGRTLMAVQRRSDRLGVRFARSAAKQCEKTSARTMWLEAMAAVPRSIPEHTRQDLISDLMIRRLEGDRRPWAAILKEAKTRHNAMTGAFKEKSAFTTIGDSELTLLDTFADDVERF